VEDLKEKLITAIQNEDFRIQIKENARKYVEENSVEKITQKLENLLIRLLYKH